MLKQEEMKNIKKSNFSLLILFVYFSTQLYSQKNLKDSINTVLLNNYFAYNLINNNKIQSINGVDNFYKLFSDKKNRIHFMHCKLIHDKSKSFLYYKFYTYYNLGVFFESEIICHSDSLIETNKFINEKIFKTPSMCNLGLVAYDTINKKISIISGDDVFIDYEFYEKNKLTDEEKARFFGYMFSYQGLPFEKNKDGYWCGRTIIIKDGKPYFDLKNGGRLWDER